MPNYDLDITPTTDRVATRASQLTDPGPDHPGFIFSICAFIKDGSATSGQVHVQAGTAKHPLNPDDTLTVLLDDYVYDGHSPTWTGKLVVEEGEGFWASVRSDGASVTVRVTGKILKYDP